MGWEGGTCRRPCPLFTDNRDDLIVSRDVGCGFCLSSLSLPCYCCLGHPVAHVREYWGTREKHHLTLLTFLMPLYT